MDKRSLVIGYGNIDRQDDGVAWHVLQDLSARLNAPVWTAAEDLPGDPSTVHLLFQLQLTPELVEYFTKYERIYFVDALTGETGPSAVPSHGNADVKIREVAEAYQSSPLTHHLTPESCLALLKAVYHGDARGLLVSIKGYEFGFSHQMSSRTSQSARQAADLVYKSLMEDSPSVNPPNDEVTR